MLHTVQAMNEQESQEVAKMLMRISDARTRARQAADSIEKAGGADHVVKALRDSENDLADLHRRLAQGTYYAITDDSLRLAV